MNIKFENSINNKIYVGASTNPELRYRKHLEASKTGDNHFYRAIRKYGINNFKFEIIECTKLENLFSREKYWIAKLDSYKNGYNSTVGGEGGNTFAKRTPEQMKITGNKISESLKGSRNGNRGQYVGEKDAMYGKHLTDEHKRKMSAKLKGVPKSEEMRVNLSKATKGVPKNYVNHSKYLYLYNLDNQNYKRLQANKIREILKIDNFKVMKEIIDNKK